MCDRLRLTDVEAEQLAQQFGTPLYIISEQIFRTRIRAYRDAFHREYPKTEITYASKANSTVAILKIAHEEGCLIDVASEGELRAALLAGIPARDCHLHGNNKSPEELLFAIQRGIGQIIVDNFEELHWLRAHSADLDLPELLIRVAPGVDPKTHERISTGQADTKFGFQLNDGSAIRAVEFCIENRLPVSGLHCHVGSQLTDPEAQIAGGEALVHLALHLREHHDFDCKIINLGGGLGVAYDENNLPLGITEYCHQLIQRLQPLFDQNAFHPILVQEPGRSLIAEAGSTLYRVGVIKDLVLESGARRYVVVDGGLSDNPRPAMYSAVYPVSAHPVRLGSQLVTISGKHCETDTLFQNVRLESQVQVGDLIEVHCTGAYNSSMSSQYNRFLRPATVLVRPSGDTHVVQRRDTWEEMFAREILSDE